MAVGTENEWSPNQDTRNTVRYYGKIQVWYQTARSMLASGIIPLGLAILLSNAVYAAVSLVASTGGVVRFSSSHFLIRQS